MTRTQVGKLLLAMVAAWPSLQIDEFRIDVWSAMIADIKPETAVLALQVLMSRKTFPPSIAEFRQVCWEIQTPAEERLDEGAAWGMVNAAIDAALFSQGRDHSAFQELPAKVLACCREIGFTEMVNGDLDVVRSTFLRFFRATVERERGEGVLPARLREAIAGLSMGKQPEGLGAGFGIIGDGPATTPPRSGENEEATDALNLAPNTDRSAPPVGDGLPQGPLGEEQRQIVAGKIGELLKTMGVRK
jgi:hypothetical protein